MFTHPCLPVLCRSKDIVPAELVGWGIGARHVLDTEFSVLKLVCRQPLSRPSSIVLMRKVTGEIWLAAIPSLTGLRGLKSRLDSRQEDISQQANSNGDNALNEE